VQLREPRDGNRKLSNCLQYKVRELFVTLRPFMPRRRRQSTAAVTRDRASDEPASVPALTNRLRTLETVCAEMREAMDAQLKRIIGLQAHIDHLSAKIAGRS
jgi:hypothetical protein